MQHPSKVSNLGLNPSGGTIKKNNMSQEEIDDLRNDRADNYRLEEGDFFIIDENVLTDNEKVWFKDVIGKIGQIKFRTWAHGYMVGYKNGYMVSFKNNEAEYYNAEILKLV